MRDLAPLTAMEASNAGPIGHVADTRSSRAHPTYAEPQHGIQKSFMVGLENRFSRQGPRLLGGTAASEITVRLQPTRGSFRITSWVPRCE
jgi:hypothetical protein